MERWVSAGRLGYQLCRNCRIKLVGRYCSAHACSWPYQLQALFCELGLQVVMGNKNCFLAPDVQQLNNLQADYVGPMRITLML